jgi:uncharacterized protein (DUF433 family)
MIAGEARIERKPYLKAEMVARMSVDGDYTIEAVMEHYDLTPAEVHAALAYYYDHRDVLDAKHQAALDEIHENAITFEKFRAKLAQKASG